MANIAANAQGGEWDEIKLKEMIREISESSPDFDLDIIGFSASDLYQAFGHDILGEQPETLIEMSEKLRSISDLHKEIYKKNDGRDDVDFYTVLVFPDEKTRRQAHEQLGLSDNRYQDGLNFIDIIAKSDKQ